MNIETILIFLGLFALIAYWSHHTKISAKAVSAAKTTLDQQGLQLLDQGVVLAKIYPYFSRPFNIRLKRIFRFEFSAKGDRRYLGWVILIGNRVQTVTLQPFSDNTLH